VRRTQAAGRVVAIIIIASIGLLHTLGRRLLLIGGRFVGSDAVVTRMSGRRWSCSSVTSTEAVRSRLSRSEGLDGGKSLPPASAQDGKSVAPEASDVVPPRTREAIPGSKLESSDPEVLAETALGLLRASSLSEADQDTWQRLHDVLVNVTPAAGETKSQAPSPDVLAAVRIARADLDAFVATLSIVQQDEVKEITLLRKRERKLRSKEETARWRAETRDSHAEVPVDAQDAGIKKRQKEVMTRAFFLYQQEQGSKIVDSTEWKRLRALGGKDPVLRNYIMRAGWDPSWPLPEPEGRLLRREGQRAALEHYSRKR